MRVSRRNWLRNAGMVCFGAAAGGTVTSLCGAPTTPAAAATPLPWPYVKLDADAVAAAAYEMHYKAGCCYAVSASIIGELARKIGSPYTSWPAELMTYGGAGVAGIGSLCGALNGAAMVTFLVTGSADKAKQGKAQEITRDIFNWYAQTPLPTFRPAQPKFENVKIVSRSNLCHVSVSKWCKASKCKISSKEREERCACLSGSVAKYTVELLNAHLAGEFKAVCKLPAESQTCRDCHDKGSPREDARVQMDCGVCHFTKTPHPTL
ncbi:MAG: C-GCAxxG-C-C family protein [Verrucomicrobiae bacterium]|nr:C-GCAxxG-C-C family protein [Verrucomicrobiae bacterium]